MPGKGFERVDVLLAVVVVVVVVGRVDVSTSCTTVLAVYRNPIQPYATSEQNTVATTRFGIARPLVCRRRRRRRWKRMGMENVTFQVSATTNDDHTTLLLLFFY